MQDGVHTLCHVVGGHVDHEMFLDGRVRYRETMRRGDFSLIRIGEQPRAIARDASFDTLILFLPDEALQDCASYDLGDVADPVELLPIRTERDPVVSRIVDAILSEIKQPAIGGRLIIDGLTLQLAGHLVRTWSNLSAPFGRRSDNGRGGLAPWQIKRTCEVMMAHLDADLGLDDLAQIAGCSPTHFSRAFKQSMGIAPFHWLAEQRIQRAKELLESGRHSLAEIALAVGFSAQAQFTTAFGRATGVTPGVWRRERLR